VHPLVPDEIVGFCAGKRAVLVVEEGSPEFVEQALLAILRRADAPTHIEGKGPLPAAGEYTVEVLARGLVDFLGRHAPELPLDAGRAWLDGVAKRRDDVAKALADPLPARPPQFCIGCPERPVFAAMKLAKETIGRCTSRPTSAATRSRRSSRSTRATRSWATA
jgi:indolepyruvate ferredoxin oxidoreductase alpha subunit